LIGEKTSINEGGFKTQETPVGAKEDNRKEIKMDKGVVRSKGGGQPHRRKD